MNNKIKIAIIITLIISGICTAIVLVYFHTKNNEKGNSVSDGKDAQEITVDNRDTFGILTANKLGILQGQNTQIEFSFETTNPISTISLYKDGDKIGDMIEKKVYDAYRYSLATDVSSSNEGQKFVAKTPEGQESNVITIYSFSEPTEEEKKKTEIAINELSEVAEKYEENGYIIPDKYYDALDATYKKAQELMETGDVLYTSKDDYSVIVQFSTGIWFIYEPSIEGTLSGDSAIVVYTVEPFKNDPSDDYRLDDDNEINVLKSAEIIEENVDVKAVRAVYDADVNLSFLDSLGKNQIILWFGHGRYNEKLGPVIGLGTRCDLWLGYEKRVNGELFINEDGILAFSGNYVKNHFGDMSGSILFFASCCSMKSNKLAEAFISKGAEYVIGFTDVTSRPYGLDCMLEFAKQLVKKDDNGHFRTMEEIFKSVKDKHPRDNILKGLLNKFAGLTWSEIQGKGNNNYSLQEDLKSVTFDTNGGDAPGLILINKGEMLTEEYNYVPKKDDFTFEGWYLDKDLTQECHFPLKIEDDITLYAKWSESSSDDIDLSSDSVDLGELFMQAVTLDDYIGFDNLTTDFVSYTEDSEDDMILHGSINGKECLELDLYDNSTLIYETAIDGYTICGTYPGEKYADAQKALIQNGFELSRSNDSGYLFKKNVGTSSFGTDVYYMVFLYSDGDTVSNILMALEIDGAG